MKLSVIVLALIVVLTIVFYMLQPKAADGFTASMYTGYAIKPNPGESSSISVESGEKMIRS